MKRVQNLELLEKFSQFYRDYKILPFGDNKKNFDDFKKDFLNNQNLILSSLKILQTLMEKEYDEKTPITQIIFQVVSEGFITEKRFIDVQLNLKRWQEVAKLTEASSQLQKMLMILTGFRL